MFSEASSSLRSRTLFQAGPQSIQNTLSVGDTPDHFTQSVHTVPQTLPLSQAGLAAPGSVDKGMTCPLEWQNSIQKVPPQKGVIPGVYVESDTTTQDVKWSNKGLEVLVVASCPDLDVQRLMGGLLESKGMVG